jgi:hypothetical protein
MLGRLGLELHPQKTRVGDAKDGFDFLGVHIRLCRVRKPKAKLKYNARIWPSNVKTGSCILHPLVDKDAQQAPRPAARCRAVASLPARQRAAGRA